MKVLVLNPGGNSLKVEIVSCQKTQRHAFEGKDLLSVGIEGIGNDATLSLYEGKKTVHTKAIKAADYGDAVSSLFRWLESTGGDSFGGIDTLECIGLRVVHGGMNFNSPALIVDIVKHPGRWLQGMAAK
jgi:acetate kinase